MNDLGIRLAISELDAYAIAEDDDSCAVYEINELISEIKADN